VVSDATQLEIKMKHKHAEILHAIADGIPVQMKWGKEWIDFDPEKHGMPYVHTSPEYWRIKPAEVPQWRKDMAQAIKDGKVVEFFSGNSWNPTGDNEENFLNPSMFFPPQEYYRIRPEPDVVKYLFVPQHWGYDAVRGNSNIKLTFDANGNLKAAEVLK
jgi:hypothetical protein